MKRSYILNEELKSDYYKNLFFKGNICNNLAAMDSLIKCQSFVFILSGLIGVSLLSFWYFFHDIAISIKLMGREGWGFVVISIMAFYLCIDAILLRGYWSSRRMAWKNPESYDIYTKRKKLYKILAWIYNLPSIGIVLLLKKILVKSHLDILFTYGQEIVFSTVIAWICGPTIILSIASRFIEQMDRAINHFDFISIKTFAYPLVFFMLLTIIVIQKWVLFYAVKVLEKQSKQRLKEIRREISRKLDIIGLIVGLVLNCILNLFVYNNEVNQYIVEGVLYSMMLFTAWIALKDKIKEE